MPILSVVVKSMTYWIRVAEMYRLNRILKFVKRKKRDQRSISQRIPIGLVFKKKRLIERKQYLILGIEVADEECIPDIEDQICPLAIVIRCGRGAARSCC